MESGNRLAGQAAMLIDLYNVSVLPRCFLIDEDHKILMKTGEWNRDQANTGELVRRLSD